MDYDSSAATSRIAELLSQIEELRKVNIRYEKIIDKYIE
jgi:hypothetical protein